MFEWSQDQLITHRSFRIVDVLDQNDALVDKVFEDCTIYGPAVVVSMSSAFEHCTFEAEVEAMLWEIAPHRSLIVGAIPVHGCTFRRCRFRNIGFAGPKEAMDQFREGVPG